MKFLNDEAAASRTIDRELSQLDRRWNTMAKDIIARLELVCRLVFTSFFNFLRGLFSEVLHSMLCFS